MGPSDFRSKKWATRMAFGGPRSSGVRHGTLLRQAPQRPMAPAKDWTAFRLPYVWSPPALSPQTPTKHPAYAYAGVVALATLPVLLPMKRNLFMPQKSA